VGKRNCERPTGVSPADGRESAVHELDAHGLVLELRCQAVSEKTFADVASASRDLSELPDEFHEGRIYAAFGVDGPRTARAIGHRNDEQAANESVRGILQRFAFYGRDSIQAEADEAVGFGDGHVRRKPIHILTVGRRSDS
jgi:hypothetical protein